MMKKILIFFITILALGQGGFYYKNIKNVENNNINIEECIYEEDNVKNIKDINTDLKIFKNNKIISYNKSGDKWVININLKGNKEEINENLLDLMEDYHINRYDLSYNNKIFTLELEIQGK